MSEIKIHIFHIGKVCVAPELTFGGEHYSALKASGVLDRKSKRLWLPVSAYLIECAHGNVLFDCGWHRDMSPHGIFERRAQIRSLGSLPMYFTNQVVVESSAAIDEQLAARGVAPVDWDAVLLSHLDCDHANGLKLVADAKKILVLKDELRFAENGSPVNRIRYNADWWRGTKMQTFDWNGLMGSAGRSYDVFGDGMLMMVNIPGHSKGLCALGITGEDGRLRRRRPREKIVGRRCCSPASPTTARRRKSRSRGSGHRVGSGTALRASPTTIPMSNRARLHYKRVTGSASGAACCSFQGLIISTVDVRNLLRIFTVESQGLHDITFPTGGKETKMGRSFRQWRNILCRLSSRSTPSSWRYFSYAIPINSSMWRWRC